MHKSKTNDMMQHHTVYHRS